MQRNKGFTLIELLAVIIILAAMALIIAPLVLDIIREQQKKTFKESINGILRSSKLEIVNSGLSFPATFTYSDGKLLSPTGKELKVTGKIPDGSGSVIYYSEDDIVLGITDNTWCGTYNKTSKEVEVDAFSGSCQVSENLEYTPEECFDFDDSTGTITKYYKSNNNCSMEVVIPDTIGGVEVKKVGEGAFCENYGGRVTGEASKLKDDKSLLSVVLPSGLLEISENAFLGQAEYFGTFNSDLSIVDMHRSTKLKTIGEYAFYNANITNLEIPNSVTSIGSHAFYSNQLTSVTIPDSMTSIGGWAFYNNQLTSVTIPNSVINIGDSAFYSNQLTSVTIPSGVMRIGEWVFSNNQLTSVTIPNSVTSIGFNAFSYNQLTSVEIPNSVKSIGREAFENNQLTSVTLPNSVTFIGEDAFHNNQLKSITIGNGVTSIGECAFQANLLAHVEIPSNVMSIGTNAFYNNVLSSVTIKGKSSSADFTSYPSDSPFGWLEGYSDSNIVWNG